MDHRDNGWNIKEGIGLGIYTDNKVKRIGGGGIWENDISKGQLQDFCNLFSEIKEDWQRGRAVLEGKTGDQKFTYRHVKFKLLIDYRRGCVKEAVGYKGEVLTEYINLEVIRT